MQIFMCDDWPAIRARILARAKNRCERCGRHNYAVLSDGQPTCGNGPQDAAGEGKHWPSYEPFSYADAQEFAQWCRDAMPEETWTVVVLTIAHLNHDITDNRDSNLRAWCQRCHNRHDAKLRAVHASGTRDRKRGQARFVFA